MVKQKYHLFLITKVKLINILKIKIFQDFQILNKLINNNKVNNLQTFNLIIHYKKINKTFLIKRIFQTKTKWLKKPYLNHSIIINSTIKIFNLKIIFQINNKINNFKIRI